MIGVGIPFTGNLSCPVPTQVKVAAAGAVSSLSSDGANLYWIESGTSIKKISVAGGSVTTLVSGRSPQAIQVANGSVYWTDSDDTINSVSTSGGGSVQIQLNFGSGQFNFRVDSSKIFLRSGLSITISGGTVATVFTPNNNSGGIAIDNVNVYWAEATFPGNLKQVSKGGGAVTTLISNSLPPPFWIAADGTNVYWATHGGFGGPYSLNRVPVGGGSNTAINNAFLQDQIFVDNISVYYTNSDIIKVNKAGGTAGTIAAWISPYNQRQNGPIIAMDSNSVYWNNGDNSIWKIDKCNNTASAPFPSIPNMTLRLRADLGMSQSGGQLVQWTSQCGSNNGSIATVSPGQAPSGGGTAPTIVPNQVNGHSVVRFNGTSDTLNFDNAGTAINSARWQLADFTGTDFGAGNVGSNTVIAIWRDTTTSVVTSPDYNIPNVLGTFYANQWFFANTTGIGCQTFFSNPPVRAFIAQAPGTVLYTESTTDFGRSAPKGLLKIGTTGSTAPFDIFTWANNADLFIGHNSFGGTYLSMDLCELIIHNRALTANELAAYAAYFNSYWGPGL